VVLNQDRAEPPPFPYIVFPVILPDFLQGAIATVSIWDKRPANPGFMGLINDAMRQISENMPTESGVVLNAGDTGLIWLQRGNPFQSIIGDPDDRAITRGICNISIRGYVL
jgi:hypothetical protein